jgi:alkane 1-monooxygenase
MILLAVIPPLWRRVMDPRVVEHYEGDLHRANLDGHKREALLRRYAPSA